MIDLIQAARDWKDAHEDFPLYVHKTKRYAKKVRGVTLFFGYVADPIEASARAAWNKWTDEKDHLLNGRKPPQRAGEGVVTIKDLINHFLCAKEEKVELGQRSPRTLADYHAIGNRIADEFGRTRAADDLQSDDFDKLLSSFQKTLGPVSTANAIQRTRTIFKWGLAKKLLTKPADYGPDFVKPAAKVMRKARREAGIKMFEAAEVRQLLDTAGPQMKAMILLAANCAFGNHDCASLPIAAVDLDKGWVVYPRPKTEIERRCPLWPETIAALKTVLARRRDPKDSADASLLFITKYGQSWCKDFAGGPVGQEFTKLVKEAGLARPGRGFYSLRHGWRTVADASRDFPAVDLIMGHVDSSMAGRYRERIDDSRLVAVSNAVREWLYPKAAKKATPKKASPKSKSLAPKISKATGKPTLRIVRAV